MVRRRIAWTPAAIDDLDQTVDYIGRDSKRYAATFARRLRDAARSLSKFAERAPRVPEFSDETIRELFVHRYRMIFRVKDHTVEILGIIHGARDMKTAWKKRTEP